MGAKTMGAPLSLGMFKQVILAKMFWSPVRIRSFALVCVDGVMTVGACALL